MDASKQQLTGMKKRQQIANANKMIFVWVIIASVAISLCGVTIQFLFRQAAFNQKIISAKLETQGVLSNNLENVDKLKENVNGLLADARLSKVKANPEDTNLKVVLDALPTEDDKSALGASLQQIILPKSGITTSDLTTISDLTNSTDEATGTDAVPTSPFNYSVVGNYDQTKTMLKDLERTIRPLNVMDITFQSADGNIRSSVSGVAYYLPEQTVQLGKKTLKP